MTYTSRAIHNSKAGFKKAKFTRKGSRSRHSDHIDITIQHWQLRDLLQRSPNNEPDDLVYVSDSSIMRYNTKSKKSCTMANVSFNPVCLASRFGYFAVGGHDSQVAVGQMPVGDMDDGDDGSITSESGEEARLLTDCVIGGSINNACHLAKIEGYNEVNLLLCNNDRTIKIFSLPTMSLLSTIRHGIAVNHCAVDRAGQLVAAVGDNPYTVLYDTRQSNSRIARFREFTDGAFGIDFSPDSILLSAASQDGTVCVWDLRMQQVLWKTYAVQNQPKGAARCVTFAPRCGVDLLMWTEHFSMVHIADMRTFEQQSIRLSSGRSDVSISGCTFSSEADRIFVGTEDFIEEFAIDIYGRRTSSSGELM